MEAVLKESEEKLSQLVETAQDAIVCDVNQVITDWNRSAEKIFGYSKREIIGKLISLPCMVMIYGYESALYKESLKSWHTHCFQAACHHSVATEWLWMNYKVPVDLHEYRYLGNNFRERERIKRKTKRWAAKLQSMPISERQALLSALDEALGLSVSSKQYDVQDVEAWFSSETAYETARLKGARKTLH